MSKELRTNEDSWKIDVISEINSYVKNKSIRITHASGELTIPEINRFPDVVLYGGVDGTELLQGWELKMPDTPITNDDPLKLAEEKARTMGLNSFTLWNAREAAIYIKNEHDEYVRIKSWVNSEIRTREDVRTKRLIWVETLHDIIDTLNSLLNGMEIKAVSPVDTINASTYERFINDLTPTVSEIIKAKTRKDRQFSAMIDEWWDSTEKDYPDKSNKTVTMAKMVIVGWVNRFVFTHYLKKYFDVALKVDEITEKTDIKEAMRIFNDMSDVCDFYNVLSCSFADDCLDDYCWKYINELNNFLKSIRLNKISQESLQSLLKNVVTFSKRESAGQFCTPPVLAKFLVELTMSDAEGTVIDPCCGTGTIPRAAIEVKKDRMIPNPYGSVWASDKFPYPLSLASISLANPNNVQTPVQVFKEDVFKLHPGMVVELTDPKTGSKIPHTIQRFDTIVSNLPFVRFEDAEGSNPDVRKMGLDNKRSDLYAYIALNLKNILKENGRMGIIVSNSWLGTDWGEEFRNALIQQYNIEYVIISQAGRWFKDADVVTTIIILQNRKEPYSEEEEIKYLSITENIENWENKKTFNSMVTDILLDKSKSEHFHLHKHKVKEIHSAYEAGFGPMICFSNIDWIPIVISKMTSVSNYFEIARGSRRGQNDFFYPKNPDVIEEEYLRPVLKSSRSVLTLIAEPDGMAFCCLDSIEELKKKGKVKTLSWINAFKDGVNEKGKPLVEVLKRPTLDWYQMTESECADMGLSVNPGNKLWVFRFKEKTFVDQRIIRLSAYNDTDIDLCHALMNSTLGMLMIESLGFGRGLGALDLNASKLKKSYRMLNPSLISKEKATRILELYEPLLKRNVKEVQEEVVSADRIAFDRAVLESYGIAQFQDEISDTLLEIYHIRTAVEVDKRRNNGSRLIPVIWVNLVLQCCNVQFLSNWSR